MTVSCNGFDLEMKSVLMTVKSQFQGCLIDMLLRVLLSHRCSETVQSYEIVYRNLSDRLRNIGVVSYGVTSVKIMDRIDSIITAPYCNWNSTPGTAVFIDVGPWWHHPNKVWVSTRYKLMWYFGAECTFIILYVCTAWTSVNPDLKRQFSKLIFLRWW